MLPDFEEDIASCIKTLLDGGTILYPTDTIWGIGCDAVNKKAIEKIYSIKKRDEAKNLILLVADKKMLLNYIEDPGEQFFDYLAKQKKPTTVIYNPKNNIPFLNDGTIAIRITDDEFCKALIHVFNKPIVSTSANTSGDPSPKNFSEISDKIKNGVDYIVQHRQNDFATSVASSIIKPNKNNSIEILRS